MAPAVRKTVCVFAQEAFPIVPDVTTSHTDRYILLGCVCRLYEQIEDLRLERTWRVREDDTSHITVVSIEDTSHIDQYLVSLFEFSIRIFVMYIGAVLSEAYDRVKSPSLCSQLQILYLYELLYLFLGYTSPYRSHNILKCLFIDSLRCGYFFYLFFCFYLS